MTEALYVILGWLLSFLTMYIRDFIKEKDDKIQLLDILLLNLIKLDRATWQDAKERYRDFSGTKNSLQDHIYTTFIPTTNTWWNHEKLTFMRILPKEANQFDKWNEINESIDLLNATKEEKANYASLTKETKNNLEQAIKYWQQSWYTILLHRLKHK